MTESSTFSQRIMPHSRKMFAVAYHYLQSGAEAEDVVQDVMVKLWQMREKLPPGDQLLPFLLTVTKNLCIDRLRKNDYDTLRYDYDTLRCETVDDDDDRLESKDRLRQTLRLMKELPPDQEKVLKLKVFEELENEQIAQIMNIKEDNVRQLLSRARRKLKELALKQGVI